MEETNQDLPDNAPQPRLCHIVKWSHFDGYGFNLHADKSKPGQYIGKVDKDSPAEMAGLKELDRIIEVNGVNISNENHKQVVQRIKSLENETKLLVVDIDTDVWYKEHNLVAKSDQSNVLVGTSKSNEPEEVDDKRSIDNEITTTPSLETEDNNSNDSGSSSQANNSDQLEPAVVTSQPDSVEENKHDVEKNYVEESKPEKLGLNLNMTVAEMRAQLSARKKTDPRNEDIDLKKKYQIIQNM